MRVIAGGKDNIFIMSNGDVLALTANSARIAGSFNAQDIYVDGNHIGEIRRNTCPSYDGDLSEDGVVLYIFATVDFKSKMILAEHLDPWFYLHGKSGV